MIRFWIPVLTLVFIMVSSAPPTSGQAQVVNVCPGQGIQPQPPDFQPGGIILTTFDRSSLWVYNIATQGRYPLPETVPCTRNCRLSPDALWLSRIEPNQGFAFYKMRMDGTQRTLMVSGAADVEWWTPDTLLVWTTDNRAYLLPDNTDDLTAIREYIDVTGVVSIQPGGRYALAVRRDADNNFVRELENLELRNLVGVAVEQSISLGEDIPYYNGAAWSADGRWLAFVDQTQFDDSIGAYGSELFGIQPGDSEPTQWTNLFGTYGAVRINGHTPGDLSWSPDHTRVAFWVTELIGSDPLANTGSAVIHIYDVTTGTLTAYCGYSTIEHTPNPPRLVWSPSGTHLAFGGNIPEDDKGYLLLALDTQSGTLTELSSGIYPALGNADVIAWGRLP